MIPVAVVVLAKVPRPGRVKTRLCPPYTPSQAADLAAAALNDTLAAVAGAAVARRVLAIDGFGDDGGDDGWDDGGDDGWERPGFDLLAQRGDGLDERITYAFHDVFGLTALPTLLVGMDTPQVSQAELTAAAALLASAGDHFALLGPAVDGGFWALGLSSPPAGGLRGVPMSTAHTGAATAARLRSAGFDVRLLPVHRDVDDAASAAAVAAIAPHTAFARTLATIRSCELTA